MIVGGSPDGAAPCSRCPPKPPYGAAPGPEGPPPIPSGALPMADSLGAVSTDCAEIDICYIAAAQLTFAL